MPFEDKQAEARLRALEQLLKEQGPDRAADVEDTQHKESVMDLLGQQAAMADSPEEQAAKLHEQDQVKEAIRRKFMPAPAMDAPAPEADPRLEALKSMASPDVQAMQEQLKAILNKNR